EGKRVWAQFIAGEPSSESTLTSAVRGLKFAGRAVGARNREGDNIVGYALRRGYLALAEAALSEGLLPLPIIGNKYPLMVWTRMQSEAVKAFVATQLTPRLEEWIATNIQEPALQAILPKLLHSQDLAFDEMHAPLAVLGPQLKI